MNELKQFVSEAFMAAEFHHAHTPFEAVGINLNATK
jgi:hypothetical protein